MTTTSTTIHATASTTGPTPIILGAKYRDIITGFTGICTGHCCYISGCHQSLITPESKSSQETAQSCWFDDQRLERVGTSLLTLANHQTPGPDMPAPIR